MVTAYEYITLAELEAFALTDYSAVYPNEVEATVNANVEAVISQSEREVNTKVGQSFAVPIPDAIVAVTTELSYRRMYNRMVWDGIMDRENPKRKLMPLWDDDLQGLIKPFIAKTVSPIKLLRLYNNDPTRNIQ